MNSKKFYSIITIIFAVITFCFSANSSFAQVPQIERDALIVLYDSTNGNNWNNNTDWLSADVSTWYGITVSHCFPHERIILEGIS